MFACCLSVNSIQEWILSDDEKKVKRNKIIENRRKKDHSGPSNLYDTYSNSSDTYSPELKPAMKGLNSDLLNSNYSLSVSEGKGFFNSLYLLEQYQNQYHNYLSGKPPKEPMVPYSSPNAKVPNPSAADHPSAKSDSVLRSPPPMATTSNSPLLDGYSSIFQKGLEPAKQLEYGFGPFPNNNHQHRPAMQTLHRSISNTVNSNYQPMQDKSDTHQLHPIHSQFYPKNNFNNKPEIGGQVHSKQLDQISSSSSNSSYQLNSFYHEKNLTNRSRSESQITSPDIMLNGKTKHARPNGSTDSNFTKENGMFCIVQK